MSIIVKLRSSTLPGTVFFDFGAYEVPEKIGFGGEHRLAVHELIGGKRVVDAMGRNDHTLDWSGLFIGQDALTRARYLDSLRVAGNPLTLTWSEFSYTVVIKSFVCSFEQFYKLPYSLSCLVVTDNTKPVTSAPVLSFDAAITGDLTTASTLATAVNDGTLNGLMTTLNTAISAVSKFATATNSVIQSVLQPIANVQARVKILIASTGNAVINTTTFGGVLSTPAGLQNKVNSAANLSSLYQLDAVTTRMHANVGAVNQTNVATANQAKIGTSGAQTITVTGGNLYALAAKYYGDASQWTVIAQANNLTDPQIVGTKTLTIPANPTPTGGVPRA